MEWSGILQSALILWDFSIKVWGGVGWGVWLLAVKVYMLISFCFYHVTCMASGVTVSIHCFACLSTLEAILFSWSLHLLPDPGFRVSPAQLHKALSFSWYMVPVTLLFADTRGTFTVKNSIYHTLAETLHWHDCLCLH